MSENITINIKTSGDLKYEVSISPSSTISELKNEIATKADVPSDRQRLIYSGRVLKDTETVSSYKIQAGHTIHLVKSAASKPAAPSASNNETTSAADNNRSDNSSGVPSNIAAGQGAFNPLADLTGARYAGYTQLPSASMFGPDGGMNNAAPDPEQLSQMMSNPMFQESMNAMLSNPQMIDFMINQSPQLRAMGPQVREMLQSPFFRQMMSNPETMRSMMELSRNSGLGGVGAQGSDFPAPGANPTASGPSSEDNNQTDSQNTAPNASNPPQNPFASLFPGGVPPIDPFALLGGAGAGGAGGAGSMAAPADNRPPEERYEQQLRQLNDMGFFDFDRNVAALRRSGGSVQGAVEYLLSN
ncbi:Piso0_002000 [Millerozyma farinosa CBS 7064]|uniref:Piso0_002000 protein n=1 Tax=Pichia sorbitophila (strain ATCC MYA-4447 / BCRC 22081 / CBS 7064 / NBRC 10061 / NRRL Y-12695) TaxID=559304 RepID=G8YM96_PICSO|nr:Piso0_002000 [Millerozyma farinosa CBS 7064]